MKKLFYDIEVFEKMNLVGLLDEDGKGYVIVNAPNLPSNVFEVDGVQIYLNVGKVRERANESLLMVIMYLLVLIIKHTIIF